MLALNPPLTVSFYMITLMSVLKFYAVMYPIRYRYLTNTKVNILISVLWIVPFLLVAGVNFIPELHYKITDGRGPSVENMKLYFIIICIFNLIIPFMVTIISFIVLCVSFYRYRKNRSQLGYTPGNNANRQQRTISTETVNFMKKMGFITTGYMLTCGPFIYYDYICYQNIYHYNLHFAFYQDHLEYRYFYTILYLNSIVDVIVYSFMDVHFRNYLRKYFSCFHKYFTCNCNSDRNARDLPAVTNNAGEAVVATTAV